MARISGEIKRGFLRTLYRGAQSTGPTPLADALNAFQDGGFEGIKSGRLVISHAGAGKQVTFQTPQIWQSFTQEQVFSLTEELQAVYADAIITLSANGNASPTDDQIFAVMIADDRLQTITTYYNDFYTLRFPW